MSDAPSTAAAGVGPAHAPGPAGAGATRDWVLIGAMILIGLPGIILRVGEIHPPDIVAAATFGVAILAAAFLLSWAVETAQPTGQSGSMVPAPAGEEDRAGHDQGHGEQRLVEPPHGRVAASIMRSFKDLPVPSGSRPTLSPAPPRP